MCFCAKFTIGRNITCMQIAVALLSRGLSQFLSRYITPAIDKVPPKNTLNEYHSKMMGKE